MPAKTVFTEGATEHFLDVPCPGSQDVAFVLPSLSDRTFLLSSTCFDLRIRVSNERNFGDVKFGGARYIPAIEAGGERRETSEL